MTPPRLWRSAERSNNNGGNMRTLHEERLGRQRWTQRENRLAERCERQTLTALLDRISPIPNPLDSAEQFARANHLDLESMTPDALRLERARIRQRLLLDPTPVSWLAERLAAVEAALT